MTPQAHTDAQAVPRLTGADYLDRIGGWKHPNADACPKCGDRVQTVAIVNLVYAFEECTCPAADYTHLRERLWHSACFAPFVCPGYEPFRVRGYGSRPTRSDGPCRWCGRTEATHGSDGAK